MCELKRILSLDQYQQQLMHIKYKPVVIVTAYHH